jgi:hypothetical protein
LFRIIPFSRTDRIYQARSGVLTFENGDTRFINAAYLDEQYRPAEPAGIIRIIDL